MTESAVQAKLQTQLRSQKLVRESVALRYAGEDVPALDDKTFGQLRDFIYRESGIYFAESKKYLLHARIFQLLRELGIATFREYLAFIRSRPRESAELRSLFDAITINETYFFRNEEQFAALELAIREIREHRGEEQPVRIWSAACSTGEEPYTIAIHLSGKLPAGSFEIVASDISQAAVEQARKGVYLEYSMRNMPDSLLRTCFSVSGGKYVLAKEIRERVQFSALNFYDREQVRAFGGFDIIFCCNALIYFDQPSKLKALAGLHEALRPGGFLFVGYSESLHGISRPFRLVHFPKALAYKREMNLPQARH